MKMKIGGLLILLCLIQSSVYSQYFDKIAEDESMLYAHTKQVNQFFRRFNGEEDRYGKRLPLNDSLYQNPAYRRTFIDLIFDLQSPNIDALIKNEFIYKCTLPDKQTFLDFHGGEWFAEVKTTFNYNGEEKDLILFLKIQEEEVGSKWVITNVIFEPFLDHFMDVENLNDEERKFIHPLSHELDFMNLIKVFTSEAVLEQFAEKEFHPDFLTLFIYEYRKKNLKFVTIQNVKFHFFQLENWYFEVSKFNRNINNSGWLISNLLKINSEDKKVLKALIFGE